MSTTWYDPFGWFESDAKADERSQIPGDSEVLSERVALTTIPSGDGKESSSQDKFSSWVAGQQLSYWKAKGVQQNNVGKVRRGARCGCSAPSMEDLCGDEDEEQAEISTLIKAYPTHIEESTILAQAALLVPRHQSQRKYWPEEAEMEFVDGMGTSHSSTKPMDPALGSRMGAACRFSDTSSNGTNSEDAGGKLELIINSSPMRRRLAETLSFGDDITLSREELKEHIRQCLELLEHISDESAHDAPLTGERCLDNTRSANSLGILEGDVLAEGDADHHDLKANVTPACARAYSDSQVAVGVHPCVESLEINIESARSRQECSEPFVLAKSDISEIVQVVSECTSQEGAVEISDLSLPPVQVRVSGGSKLAEMFDDEDLAVVEGQKTIESAQTSSMNRCLGMERNICNMGKNHTLSSSTESIEPLSGGDMSDPDRGSSDNKSNQSAFKCQVDVLISRVSDDNTMGREVHAATGHDIGPDSGSAGPDSFLSCSVEDFRRQALQRAAARAPTESDVVLVSSRVESNFEGEDDEIQPLSQVCPRLESFERRRHDTGVVDAVERVHDSREAALLNRQIPTVDVISDLDSDFGIASEQMQALVRKHSKDKTCLDQDGSGQTPNSDVYDRDFGVATELLDLLSRPASACTLDLMGASTGGDSGVYQVSRTKPNLCSEVDGKLAQSTSSNVTHGQRPLGLVLDAPFAFGGQVSFSRGQALPCEVGFGGDDRVSREHRDTMRCATELGAIGGEHNSGSNRAAQPIVALCADKDPNSQGTSLDRKPGRKQTLTLVDAFGLASFKTQLNSPRPACEGQSSSTHKVENSDFVQSCLLGSQSIEEPPVGKVNDKPVSEAYMRVTRSSKAVKFDLDACDRSFGVTTEAVMPQRKLADSFDLDLSDQAFGIKTEPITGFAQASRAGEDFAEIEVGEQSISDSDMGNASQATGFNDEDSNLVRPTCIESGSLGSDARIKDAAKSTPDRPAPIVYSDALTCQMQLHRKEASLTMLEEL